MLSHGAVKAILQNIEPIAKFTYLLIESDSDDRDTIEPGTSPHGIVLRGTQIELLDLSFDLRLEPPRNQLFNLLLYLYSRLLSLLQRST